MKRFIIVFSLATVVLGMRADGTLPRATAAHFCQLLVCDNDNHVMSLNSYIRQHQSVTSDSLSAEQLFCTYVFNYDGWQSLRIFPHTDTKGIVFLASSLKSRQRIGRRSMPISTAYSSIKRPLPAYQLNRVLHLSFFSSLCY